MCLLLGCPHTKSSLASSRQYLGNMVTLWSEHTNSRQWSRLLRSIAVCSGWLALRPIPAPTAAVCAARRAPVHTQTMDGEVVAAAPHPLSVAYVKREQSSTLPPSLNVTRVLTASSCSQCVVVSCLPATRWTALGVRAPLGYKLYSCSNIKFCHSCP